MNLKCDVCAENKPPEKSLCLRSWQTHKPNSIKVWEWISLCTRELANEQAFEFRNVADLATRFNICFPVPSKNPDDVLSVLEMVWINWAGPMSHWSRTWEVNSKESSVSLWKLMASDNISRHPKLPGRVDLLNAMADSGKQLQEKQSKMSQHEVPWKCEDSHPW